MKIKSFIAILLAVVFTLSYTTGCSDKSKNTISKTTSLGAGLSTKKLNIIHESEKGGVYIKISIEDFNALGFRYGDSVNIEFSNGYKLSRIPYYNGFYTKSGDPLIVAYPGFDYIMAAINNGDDLWETAELDDFMTVTVTLDSHEKFHYIQEARDLSYENDREKYPNDEVFANFRAVSANGIKENSLYRSSSPCDNQYNRASYADKLCKKAGINYVLNLADKDVWIKDYFNADDFNSPYYKDLYENGKVILSNINADFTSTSTKTQLVKGLEELSENETPYLIHCTEGKDRTGFVCILLEALAGASYEDIERDYMTTYSNYYGITKDNDSEKYDVLINELLIPMIRIIIGNDYTDVKTAELSKYARDYLIEAGMSEKTVDLLKERISAE